jgi:hypothetical protein
MQTDHGGDIDRRKSTSGYMVKVGSGVVGWSSKLQPVVTLSTTEAEYVGRSVQQAKKYVGCSSYCRRLDSHLLHHPHYSLTTSLLFLLQRTWNTMGQMKHLDLAFFWLRDKVAEGRIQVVHLRTEGWICLQTC